MIRLEFVTSGYKFKFTASQIFYGYEVSSEATEYATLVEDT
jgi:hypothetical protein